MNQLARQLTIGAATVGAAFSSPHAQVKQGVAVTANVEKSIRLNVPSSFAGNNVTVDCPAADVAGYAVDRIEAARKNGWLAPMTVRVGSYVNADRVVLPCTVIGSDADLIDLDVTVRPPEGVLRTAYSGPSSVRIGEVFRPVVRAEVVPARERRSLPVSGLQVRFSLPGMPELSGTTDRTGTAVLAESMLRGQPGPQPITIMASSPAFSERRQSLLTVTKAAVKKIVHTVPASGNVMVDEELRTISVTLEDEFKNPVCSDGPITLRLLTTPGSLYDRPNEGDLVSEFEIPCVGNGGTFGHAAYWGPIQPLTFEIIADGVHDTVRVNAIPGYPTRLNVLDDPPAFIRSDLVKQLRPAMRVRLEDEWGNRVPGQPISAHILGCGKRNGNAVPGNCVKPQLRGATLLVTDTSGRVSFDSLVFIGTEGDDYNFCFIAIDIRLRGAPPACGDGGDRLSVVKGHMRYDVDREYNQNLLIISGIHSVGGTQQPVNELFDVRFRFRLPRSFSSLASVDLPLQRKSFTDTVGVRSTRSDVPDILYMLNWDSSLRMTEPQTDALERLLFIGGQLRVFAGVPYAGIHTGSIEMGSSLFFGTTASLGYAWALSMMPVKASDGTITYPARGNIVVDAFLRSSGVDFMKFLNVRGTFILPRAPGRKVRSRIVIAVPLGTITPF
jgi:hypothetical protein